MRAIIHYKFPFHIPPPSDIENPEEQDDLFSSTIANMLMQEKGTILGVSEYHGEIDNQCEHPEANSKEQTFLDLILESDSDLVADWENRQDEIDKLYFERVGAKEHAKIISYYECGEAQFIIVEMSADHPEIEIDWMF